MSGFCLHGYSYKCDGSRENCGIKKKLGITLSKPCVSEKSEHFDISSWTPAQVDSFRRFVDDTSHGSLHSLPLFDERIFNLDLPCVDCGTAPLYSVNLSSTGNCGCLTDSFQIFYQIPRDLLLEVVSLIESRGYKISDYEEPIASRSPYVQVS